MKDSTYKLLTELLNNNLTIDFSDSSTESMDLAKKLFNIYAIEEIKDFNDLMKDHHPFIDFTREATSQITFTNDIYGVAKNSFQSTAYLLARSLILLKDSRLSGNKGTNQFSNVISTAIKKERISLLDVGSGDLPYSSILLAKLGHNVTSMDKFNLPQKTLEKLKVKSINEYFSEKTSIDPYGIVISKCACTAIANIATSCDKRQKPFIIKMCTCNSPNQKISGWQEYLKHNANAKFIGDYAFNLENGEYKGFVSNEELKDIIPELDKYFDQESSMEK